MIDHLQTALSPIAYRVVPISSFNDSIFDQNCRLMMESFGEKYQEEDFSFLPYPQTSESGIYRSRAQTPLLARVHTMVEEFISHDEQSNGIKDERIQQGVEFKFDSFIAKISIGIPIGAYYLNRKVMSIVSELNHFFSHPFSRYTSMCCGSMTRKMTS